MGNMNITSMNGSRAQISKTKQFSRVYGDAASFRSKFYHRDELVSNPNITSSDYQTLFPLFVFDVSKESERLKTAVMTQGVATGGAPKTSKACKRIRPKFAKLRTIRTNPKPVVMNDIESGEEFTFPLIYKASQFINQSPMIITYWPGRVWNNKYKIRVV
ncbi:hypothetical protein CAPTEDRAFT_203017 [Capitella teleta]|uniref:Uncharacterized protein n=1 Tax=Capitella teleta TaxID=283909 RepID=R7TNK6_CAPTE|nr:hypothetical protein CAPTEDRAFT_203017 [Capitella teleta]|eukprot:ELT95127.1 hypothetical protein CAPTEDRAFT_203017 [Capitella teleta]